MMRSKPYRMLATFSLAMLFAMSCQSREARGLKDLAGTRTRVVWVQDQGEATDPFCNNTNLKLMGFASDDREGERALLDEVGNFYKPLFLPDGEQVVVSDRLNREVFLVDWNGGKKTSLGSGVAIEVWDDPQTGQVWVYALDGPNDPDFKHSNNPLYRFPIDKPGERELVWDKSKISWSNFQISRDGTRAGGLFPWPNPAVLELDTLVGHPMGRGCWTSFSPDDSYLLWVFDQPHRNVMIYPPEGEAYLVNINNTEAVDGREVYHPRWSNHVRVLVMTGPYLMGHGNNRIPYGGRKVEVHVGRFNEELTEVEAWTQVTRNDRGDFYPDVWVGESPAL